LTGVIDVRIDRILGYAQTAGDLLGAEVLVDQSQTLPLAGRQKGDDLIGIDLFFPHSEKFIKSSTVFVYRQLQPCAI
jgi:hypothetical protein